MPLHASSGKPRVALAVAILVALVASSGCLDVIPKNMPEFKDAIGATSPPVSPVARATATPTVAKTNEPVTLSAKTSLDPTGEGLTYVWDFGAEGSSRGETVVKRFRSPGTHDIGLTVTTKQGASDRTTLTIEIVAQNAPPVARFTPEPRIALTGEAILFDASASFDPEGTALMYEWDFGDRTTTSARWDPKAEHAYERPGFYVVRLTVRDGDGLLGTSSQFVAVNWTRTWGGERVSVIEESRSYAMPVPQLANRLLVNVSFEGALGVNALRVDLTDGEGKVVASMTTAAPPGGATPTSATLSLTRENLTQEAPGDWSIVITRTQGVDIAYSVVALLAMD